MRGVHRVRRRSTVGAVAGAFAALLSATLSGCMEPSVPDPATCPAPESPPASEPGSGELLASQGAWPYGNAWVVYDDGWVLTPGPARDGGFAPGARVAPPPGFDGDAGAWEASYLSECELEMLIELAGSTIQEEVDFGSPQATDGLSTSVSYWDGGEDTRVSVYMLGNDGGLSRSQRAARERLELIGAIAESARATDHVAPATGLLLHWRLGPVDVSTPQAWPVQPIEELLGSEDCAVLSGAEAETLYRYLLDGGEVPEDVYVRALAPGFEGCT
ncbi:hypothetical protein [Ruania alba]|uniref:Lipoprotein n=1 Tax=Ruania alba TaxID=648782 RepID=A0A1H5MDC6_9MICO|nr:hypothetical protein [Ruania alba]SEE87382.1 hypothetical protein SAMN04488554_3312 [Ruania alba]